MKHTHGLRSLALAAVLLLAGIGVNAAPVDDSIMTAAKQSHIFSSHFRGNSVKIMSTNGRVTLTGTVKDEFNKSIAEETIQNIPGVVAVDNQLEVTEKIPPTNADELIAARTRSALLFHRNTSNVNVISKNGVVTIRGTVPTETSKNMIGEYVRDVDGVTEVTNEIEVSSNPNDINNVTTVSMDDISVTAQVKMALSAHRSTKDLRTRVATKDGVVTLTGAAKDQAEKDKITRMVADINGVKSVNNQMTTPEKTLN